MVSIQEMTDSEDDVLNPSGEEDELEGKTPDITPNTGPKKPTVELIRFKDYASVAKIPEREHLTNDNWYNWKERMNRVCNTCGIMGYLTGSRKRPDKTVDREGSRNWLMNDNWVQQVIMNNVSDSQMNHIRSKRTAHEMFIALHSTHENKANQSVNQIITILNNTKASEADDIPDHLDVLKTYRDRLNNFQNSEFHVSDGHFKAIVSASLPDSWQSFVEPYGGNVDNKDDPDPKRSLPADNFIGLIREQFRIRRMRKNGLNGETYMGKMGKKPLKDRIERKKTTEGPYCDFCKKSGHIEANCKKKGKIKCYNCGKYGHYARDCKSTKKGARDKDKGGGGSSSKDTTETANVMAEVAFVGAEDEGEYYNFDDNVFATENDDERLIYYDWMADNATSSHVSNRRGDFITYEPLHDVSVTGVGGRVTEIHGRGTVKLIAVCNGVSNLLTLKDVLHIPNQPHNLISLGRWNRAGGRYAAEGSRLILTSKDGMDMAEGKMTSNNLSKMNVRVYKADATVKASETFVAAEPSISWETWHRRYGHVGYSGLQKILDGGLVDGFNVDRNSPKTDCIPCTEAKQHVEPFPKSTDRKTEPGELTHIDLWGKYDVRSINGNQYYMALVDDAKRYITVEFLKLKSDAVQQVINYLTYLKTQGMNPKAIHIDRGGEFVNERLERWCKENGIVIRMTAPNSQSQNGVAERMNRTLVELARAMLRGQNLPEFLWEHATLHAAYIRNRAYTTHLKTETPYEGWLKKKPNVAHLREFGAPVWILLQGQMKDRKMLPKSKQQVYVGFDDGSKAVKYYNPETRKVLTNRNFRHITPPEVPEPPEDVVLAPDVRPEGEPGGSVMPESSAEASTADKTTKKRKRTTVEEVIDVDAPRKTRITSYSILR
jgi:transposase InsO family protein